MHLFKLTLFTLPVLTGLMVACSPGPKQPALGLPSSSGHPEPIVVNGAWTPQMVSITCGAVACPPQVGVVIYAAPAEISPAGRVTRKLIRCTASLIGADQILTNGHCVVNGSEGFFIHAKGVNRVRGVAFSVFGGFISATETAPGPDLAVLTLEQPVTGLNPLRVARGPSPDYKMLIGYVANQAKAENALVINKIECAIRRDAANPIPISENPNTIYAYDCVAVQGNSGAALFAPGSDEVQAVLHGTGVLEALIVATNVRCFPLTPAGAARCVNVTAEEVADRAKNLARAGERAATNGSLINQVEYKTRFTKRTLKILGGVEAFEVISVPKCRTVGADLLTEVVFPSEFISAATGADGQVVTTPSAPRVSVGRVRGRKNDRFMIEMKWAEAFAPLERPDLHPRAYLGKAFSIDLPECPR